MAHGCEIALQFAEQRGLGAALQHLGKKAPARAQHLTGELSGRLDQRHDLQLIGFLVTGRIRRHVGEHDVGAAVECGAQPLGRSRIEKIELHEIDARDRLHLENVDGYDFPPPLARTDTLGRDLAPAARSRAQIDHARAALQQVVLVIDLDELVGGA